MTFDEIVAFHGHKCPGLAMGYRMAQAAMDNLIERRADDEELVAIVENDACGVDALQCLTGCTFGKGNLIFHDYGKQVYTLYSRSSGAGVRVSFHGKSAPAEVRENRSHFIDWLLTAPADDLLSLQQVTITAPEPARLHGSLVCAYCGESVMETRIKILEGKPACIPCYINHSIG